MLCKLALTPIIKPVNGLCNLSCSYCYTAGLTGHITKDYMSLETLKSTIDFFCNDQDDIEFIWHGGEPLLAGIEFYKKAIEFQLVWKQAGKRINNFIQSNATLVTSEWADFFAKNNFFVGVSLDGPKEFHDKVRTYANGKRSYEDVMKGINLLRQAGVFNGVICDISTINLAYPETIFNFFIENDIKKLKFARVKDLGHCKNVSSLTISPAQYADFMISIFNLWLKLDDSEVEIRDIQSVVNLILGGSQRECIYMGKCDQFVTVYSDGTIYACDSFPKIDKFLFGNVRDNSNIIKANASLQRFKDLLKSRQEHCQGCEWYHICRGGCAKDCYSGFDDIKPIDEICESLKRYFQHISATINSYDLSG